MGRDPEERWWVRLRREWRRRRAAEALSSPEAMEAALEAEPAAAGPAPAGQVRPPADLLERAFRLAEAAEAREGAQRAPPGLALAASGGAGAAVDGRLALEYVWTLGDGPDAPRLMADADGRLMVSPLPPPHVTHLLVGPERFPLERGNAAAAVRGTGLAAVMDYIDAQRQAGAPPIIQLL